LSLLQLDILCLDPNLASASPVSQKMSAEMSLLGNLEGPSCFTSSGYGWPSGRLIFAPSSPVSSISITHYSQRPPPPRIRPRPGSRPEHDGYSRSRIHTIQDNSSHNTTGTSSAGERPSCMSEDIACTRRSSPPESYHSAPSSVRSISQSSNPRSPRSESTGRHRLCITLDLCANGH